MKIAPGKGGPCVMGCDLGIGWLEPLARGPCLVAR